jgi:multimeric flavodoxin WrbA
MREIGVVVTFSSRTGSTEKLALAAALGAVQAKAKIRLRWLPEEVDDYAVGTVPGWRENRDRMAREYIAPREIDLLWADVLILAIPARDGLSSPELKTYLAALEALRSNGKLDGKVATAFSAPDFVSLCSAFTGLHLTLVPPDPTSTGSPMGNPVDAARLHGRKVVEAARNRPLP